MEKNGGEGRKEGRRGEEGVKEEGRREEGFESPLARRVENTAYLSSTVVWGGRTRPRPESGTLLLLTRRLGLDPPALKRLDVLLGPRPRRPSPPPTPRVRTTAPPRPPSGRPHTGPLPAEGRVVDPSCRGTPTLPRGVAK